MATRTWRRRRDRDGWGDRGRSFPQRWRRRPNPVSTIIIFVSSVLTLILLAGVVLTWAKANQHNDVVHDLLRAGSWLATPFHDVFTDSDARTRLVENWLLAAAVYFVGGSVLSRLLRR